MAKAPEVEVFVHSNEVELWYNHQRIVTVGVTKQQDILASFNPLKSDSIHLIEGYLPTLQLLDLDVFIITMEKDPNTMALPKASSMPASTKVIKNNATPVKPSYSSSEADRIDSSTVDMIRLMILDSMIYMPDQTRSLRASETNRIAEVSNQRPMAVAGVRAALTRGAYGDLDQLLIRRKRFLRRQEKLASVEQS